MRPARAPSPWEKSRFIHPLVWALIQDVVSRVRPPTLLCVGTPLNPAPLGRPPPLPFLFLALIKCHLKNLYGSPSESRCEWIEAEARREGGREGGAGRITPRRNANATSQFRRKRVLLSLFSLFNQVGFRSTERTGDGSLGPEAWQPNPAEGTPQPARSSARPMKCGAAPETVHSIARAHFVLFLFNNLFSAE